MRYYRRDPSVWMKVGDSPVSEADIAVDTFLREALLKARPDYGWLSEETLDARTNGQSGRAFVVDPIDGTRAFIEGRKTWCVSVAIVEDGRPIAGVLDCPAREERFWAVRGRGAWKNGEVLGVLPPRGPARITGPKELVDRLGMAPGEIDRAPYVPSLAYRIAMVASGRLDASFVRPNSHDWDLAAADLILAEAGGSLLTREGRPPLYFDTDPRHGTLVAGSGELLSRLSLTIAALDH
ncbi:3'(2'),5'-bisphosphate nucleotidase CysQ [Chelativorans sp. ZYF759]|nr:3'(2'),5'-bisphosphate nucleotidase CysQ [Chelativorans sp. ZYF759]